MHGLTAEEGWTTAMCGRPWDAAPGPTYYVEKRPNRQSRRFARPSAPEARPYESRLGLSVVATTGPWCAEKNPNVDRIRRRAESYALAVYGVCGNLLTSCSTSFMQPRALHTCDVKGGAGNHGAVIWELLCSSSRLSVRASFITGTPLGSQAVWPSSDLAQSRVGER